MRVPRSALAALALVGARAADAKPFTTKKKDQPLPLPDPDAGPDVDWAAWEASREARERARRAEATSSRDAFAFARAAWRGRLPAARRRRRNRFPPPAGADIKRWRRAWSRCTSGSAAAPRTRTSTSATRGGTSARARQTRRWRGSTGGRAEILPVCPDVATYFERTTQAVQRCKNVATYFERTTQAVQRAARTSSNGARAAERRVGRRRPDPNPAADQHSWMHTSYCAVPGHELTKPCLVFRPKRDEREYL